MASTRTPAKHFAPLAIGAPEPYRALPVKLERMIHFIPPHNDKIRSKIKDIAGQVDVILGNLEDAVPLDQKENARKGFIEMLTQNDFGTTGVWTRINCLNSPWVLDDVTEIVAAAGNKLDVIMLPKVEGPWDIHYLDQLLAQLEARHGVKKPIPIPRHSRDSRRRQQRRSNRCGLSAYARHEPRPSRPGSLARHEDDARRRRPPGLWCPRGRR